jgi:hypothetical protein
VSFIFRCALIFVDTYPHTLFLEVNFVFQVVYEYLVYKVSLGYVALALVCCLPYGYVALRAVL